MSQSIAVPGPEPIEPTEFRMPGGSALRALLLDGEPWFFASDIAEVLGHRDASTAARILKSGEKVPHKVRTPGGDQEVLIISEPGFYRLVMRSNRPEADSFQTWVTAEVLPRIRKTGSYVAPGEDPVIALARRVLELDAQNRDLSALATKAADTLERVYPQVDGYNQLINAEGLHSLAQAAQALGLTRPGLIGLLAELGGIVVRPGHSDHLRPYQEHVRAGRFAVKLGTYTVSKPGLADEVRSSGTTYLTPKGLDWVRTKIRERKAQAAERLAELSAPNTA